MKTQLPFLAIFFFSFLINAQTPNLEWAIAAGDNTTANLNADQGQALCIDPHGNIYTTGYFHEVADFEAGAHATELTSIGAEDLYITKYYPNGKLAWAKSFGSTGTDEGTALASDDHGCIYMTGVFSGVVDFDDGPGSTYLNGISAGDIFIQKIDTLGNIIWAKSMAGTGGTSNRSNSIAVDFESNAVFVTGVFEGTVDFDPSSGENLQTASGAQDVFIQKLDLLGNAVWTRILGSADNEKANSLTCDDSGNVYVTGAFEETLDLDPGTGILEKTANGEHDSFFLKLDADGELVWAKSIGSVYLDEAAAIKLDASGNIYITGYFQGSVDFDPGIGIAVISGDFMFPDVYILKLSSLGEFKWVKDISGETDSDFSQSICIDADGFIYTTGYFRGTNDFDPGVSTLDLTSNGESDIFVQKLDSLGNLVWAISAGGDGADEGRAIMLDQHQNICVTGFFNNTVDFDPWALTSDQVSNGGDDIFVWKLNPDTYYAGEAAQPVSEKIGTLYPNPANNVLNIVLPESKNANMVMHDLSGKLIYAQNGTAQNMQLDVSGFECGTYVVTLTTDAGVSVEKLIVTH